MLNHSFILRWADRLDSLDPDVWGKGSLRPSESTRCCLGVACDLLIEGGKIGEWEFDVVGYEDGVYTVRGEIDSWEYLEVYSLPSNVGDIIGLYGDGDYPFGDDWPGTDSPLLATINDRATESPFPLIAKILRDLVEEDRRRAEAT